jgi:Xaa-Pro aminopeptidase
LARLSSAVRSYRIGRMTDLMRQHSFDALGFMAPDWVEWVSNHPVGELPWERPTLAVVTAEGRVIAFFSEQSRFGVLAEQARGTLWADRVTFFSEWPDSGRNGWLLNQWPEMVADVLAAEGLGKARLGVDGAPPALAAAAGRLPGLEVVTVGEAMRSLRWVKHPDEITVMREAASLSDWAIGVYREEIRPGRLLDELDFTVSARLSVEAARRAPGEQFVISRLFTLSGAGAAAPKGDGAPTGRVVEENVALPTLATRLNGLAMELTRPFLMSRCEQLARLFDGARAAQEAAIEVAVAGRPVREMHAAAQRVTQQVVEREGFADCLQIRMGHGMGVTQHDFPDDTPLNERPLIENEVYAIEPGVYIPQVGAFRFSDPVVVGAREPEQLTQVSKDRDWLTLAA